MYYIYKALSPSCKDINTDERLNYLCIFSLWLPYRLFWFYVILRMGGPCYSSSSFSVYCCIFFCLVFPRPVSSVPFVASIFWIVHSWFLFSLTFIYIYLDGVMVSMLVVNVVDRVIEFWSTHIKDYNCVCCFLATYAALASKIKHWFARRHDMCRRGAKCLPVESCFSALTLSNFN